MKFQKGNPGKPKGAKHKLPQKAKEALALAFEGKGGVPALLRWAEENETEFYKLWSKLVPIETEVSGKDGQVLGVVILPPVSK